MKRLAPATMWLALCSVGVSPALAQQPAVVRGTAAEIRVLRPLVNEVIAPGSFLLELSFQSRTAAGIRAAELHVDGVRWARRDFDMPLAKYVLSFDVDGRSLTAGSHRLVVKLIGADGSIAETEVPVQVDTPRPVAPTRPVGGGYGPEMAFRSVPKKLVGTVEIGVSIKEEHLNPYVSFFVDRQFKTLKNYPPYSFIWDTTTVSNGYHVIEATGYLESANATTTQRMQVYVDNPGGFTAKAAPDATARIADPKPATVATPNTSAPVVVPVASAARLSAVPAAAVKMAPAALAPIGRPADIDIAPSLAAAVAPAGASVAPRSERIAPVREKAGAAVAAMGLSTVPSAVRETVVGRPTAVTPVSTKTAVAVSAVAGPVRRAVSVAAPRPVAPVATPLATLPEIQLQPKLQIAFDGVQIAFDVQPRIEKGLPIAPFRQIFEHSGGTVTWAHNAKTVRAVNAEREVVFKVGSQSGRVNGETVRMERKATIEGGRAIVPLSFVGSALDVDIDFDPATGRLQINSKK